MDIILFQPDIAQNVGSIIRLCACMGSKLHIIEPCGFPFDDKRVRRTSMDYFDHVDLIRHTSWRAFLEFHQSQSGRLVLLSAHSKQAYTDFTFKPDDMLLLGRESAGVTSEVHDRMDETITIPMKAGRRSLNVALAASMVLGEGIRQTG